jgi:hypothetical protein
MGRNEWRSRPEYLLSAAAMRKSQERSRRAPVAAIYEPKNSESGD